MSDLEPIRIALERATRTVTLKPAFGQRTYVNTATVGSGLRCDIVEGDHSLVTDVPAGMGGSGLGPSPGALFRSAISGCVAIGLKMWAARYDVGITAIAVTVEADSDARGQLGVSSEAAPGFEEIRIRIDIESDAPVDAIEAAVEASLRTSPMIDAIGGRDAAIITTLILQAA